MFIIWNVLLLIHTNQIYTSLLKSSSITSLCVFCCYIIIVYVLNIKSRWLILSAELNFKWESCTLKHFASRKYVCSKLENVPNRHDHKTKENNINRFDPPDHQIEKSLKYPNVRVQQNGCRIVYLFVRRFSFFIVLPRKQTHRHTHAHTHRNRQTSGLFKCRLIELW